MVRFSFGGLSTETVGGSRHYDFKGQEFNIQRITGPAQGKRPIVRTQARWLWRKLRCRHGDGSAAYDMPIAAVLKDRIIFLVPERIDDRHHQSVVTASRASFPAQAEEPKRQTFPMYINGGAREVAPVIRRGWAFTIPIQYIKPDVSTICIGRGGEAWRGLFSSPRRAPRVTAPCLTAVLPNGDPDSSFIESRLSPVCKDRHRTYEIHAKGNPKDA